MSLKRYRYTGMERDTETGLAYHGARYYAPWVGRWVSCDPAALVDGSNLYRMAKGNPIRFMDTGGTESSETDFVPPAVKGYLKKHGIKFSEEVTFELINPDTGSVVLNIHGNPVRGRFDVAFRDPRKAAKGAASILELKGINLDAFHGNQGDYLELLESAKGGRIRITSRTSANIGLKYGTELTITGNNYLRVGANNLDDFAEALATLTGGRKIYKPFISHTGEAHFFYTKEEYYEFLEKEKITTSKPIEKKEPPISKTPNPTRPGAEFPAARVVGDEGENAFRWLSKAKGAYEVLGRAAEFANVVTTVVNMAECFGSDPHTGDTLTCLNFEEGDFLTLGGMSLAEYGIEKIKESGAISPTTFKKEMEHGFGEMYKWTSTPNPPRR